jgi:outer membrane protein
MHYLNKSFIIAFAVVVSLFFASASQAQEGPFAIENVPNVIGVGVGMLPDYVGSDDYMIGGAPFFKITLPKTERYLRLLATDLQVNIINHPVLRLGPALNYRFGRSDGVDDRIISKMEEIDATIEAGAFVGAEIVDKDNPRQRFISQVEFLSDVGGEYKGYNLSLTASYWQPVSKAIDVMIGGGISYADENYMKTYFGVNQEDADNTGLPVYEADAALFMAKVTAGAVLHLSQSWHIALGGQYRPLLSDASDSPVVDDRGSNDQWIAGLGLAYSW